jgi:hypothetical protein
VGVQSCGGAGGCEPRDSAQARAQLSANRKITSSQKSQLNSDTPLAPRFDFLGVLFARNHPYEVGIIWVSPCCLPFFLLDRYVADKVYMHSVIQVTIQ